MVPLAWFGAIAGLATLCVLGSVIILVREARGSGRRRRWNARVLRDLAVVSALVVIGTVGFIRPWYWSIALGAIAAVALFGVVAGLRFLRNSASAPPLTTVVSATASVLLGVLLLTLAGTVGTIDGAAVSSGHAQPTWHGGKVLTQPVLYQLFWGSAWSTTPTRPAVAQAVAFGASLSPSDWTRSIVDADFGVRSIAAAGCWIDPLPLPESGLVASSIATGPLRAEMANVVDHRHQLIPCPGSASTNFPARLPSDAVLAVWLPPGVTDDLGGISAHGAVSLPHYRYGLVAIGLSGSFAYWDRPACKENAACRALPVYASPTYALSHELIESSTNPYGNSWYANAPLSWSARYVLDHGPFSLFGQPPVYQGEVADLCEPGQPDAEGRVRSDDLPLAVLRSLLSSVLAWVAPTNPTAITDGDRWWYHHGPAPG